MVTSVLLIGIHKEELDFGDCVAQLTDPKAIDILRIPHGLENIESNTEGSFYAETQHREMYLQVQQLIKKQFQLVIDLHCGQSPDQMFAEIFCGDETLISRIDEQLAWNQCKKIARIIRIISGKGSLQLCRDTPYPCARTMIPEQVWRSSSFKYVGLEIYLPKDDSDLRKTFELAISLIKVIQNCVSSSEPKLRKG